MAGDWLKMTHALPEKPEVLEIAGRTSLSRFDVVGRLFILWRWFDTNTIDGNARGVTKVTLNACLFGDGDVTNFVSAVIDARWLAASDDGISVIKFDEHISESAKTRAQTAKRVAKSKTKTGNAEGNADGVTKTVPREEKRREESPSLRSGEDAGKPATRKRREDTNLKTYLETCKQAGARPLPADHPIRDYCADAHITDEMLQLAWIVFKDRFTTGKDKAKRQKDWPAHFANSVRGRWANLWFTDEKGETGWTSVGLQERAVAESRLKPQQGDHP